MIEAKLEDIAEGLREILEHPDFVKPILQHGERCIVRCAHLDLDKAKSWLSERGVRLLGVSGTIKKAKRFLETTRVKCTGGES